MLSKIAIKNINRLADFIESARFKFNMSDSGASPRCGTAGCIGGHAAVLWPKSVKIKHDFGDGRITWEDKKLADKLGLTDHQHATLCYLASPTDRYSRVKKKNGKELQYSDVTRRMAVACLRRLARTGEVKW